MLYAANEEIPLADTRIKFDLNGQNVDCPAKAVLHLLPNPRLALCCNLDLREANFKPGDFGNASITATLHDQETDFIAGQFAFDWNPEVFQIETVLFPTREPISVHHTSEKLASVGFCVINFPQFFGKQFKIVEANGRGQQGVDYVQLNSEPWLIEITPAPNLSEVKGELETTGGYGITHTGTVKRADGDDFSVADVDELLYGLSLFLSFARGAYCGLTLVEGKSRDGHKVWERWGTDNVTAWFRPLSWFDKHHSHVLADLFPHFWRQYQEQEREVRVAVSLYLDSNLGRSHGVGMDGGLILTQAALERMASEKDGKKTGKRIAKALLKRGISPKALCIPSESCPVLARLAAEHGWKDGPHALVEIRNTVVHPKEKYGRISARAYYEAWNLGQWYLELMLLCRFGAGGDFDYGPRLTQKWVGEVKPLGQWLVENMPRGVDLELPSRDEPERPIPFFAKEAE